MDNSNIQNDSLLSQSTSQDSIIHRKRELRGIPGSFSSNLGQRNSPSLPRLDVAKANSGNRSVRSIVAWIESSSSTSGLRVADDSTTRANDKPVANQVDDSPPQLGKLSMEPFDDSLAFLNYRNYFTDQPLARCLDTEMDEMGTKAYSETKGGAEGSRDDCILSQTGTKPIRNQSVTYTTNNRTVSFTKRTKAEIAAFWQVVREQLWISDEELDERSWYEELDSEQRI